MKIMTSNDIFQARSLIADNKSLELTAKILKTNQNTIRRYLPELADEAALRNKKATNKYVTKEQLVALIGTKMPNQAKGLEHAPMETVEQLFRAMAGK